MKYTSLFKTWLIAAALPVAALAQADTTPIPVTTTSGTDTTAFSDGGFYVPSAGAREFMLGGSGATNKDFDDSFGGVAFSYGSYVSDTLLVLVRQSVNYSNPDGGGTQWNGSTHLAVDHHLITQGRVRPFVGANFGGIYGDGVSDSWTAGIEGGVKYYVQARTFIAATVEYGWLFGDSDAIDDRFDDGQLNWSIAIGFNF